MLHKLHVEFMAHQIKRVEMYNKTQIRILSTSKVKEYLEK